MLNINVAAFGTTFLASAVEVVEAFTIVLAVGVIRGWRSALAGAAGGLAVLAALVGILGAAFTVIPIAYARTAVGIFLLFFGLKWLRKAVLRYSGWKAMHDEEQVYREEVALLSSHTASRGSAIDWFAAATSFNGVLLEGLEVIFIVIAFGTHTRQWGSATLGALAAAGVVALAGVALRRPLERVPENALKFVVGIALTTFGTQWTAEGVGAEWPAGDIAVLYLLAGYLAMSAIAIAMLRRRLTGVPARLTPNPAQ